MKAKTKWDSRISSFEDGAEHETRIRLLAQARKGDVQASARLLEQYGVRVYSESERSKLPEYGRRSPTKEKPRRRSKSSA
jgi:hypothetical protein